MYINFKVSEKNSLLPDDILFLAAVKQGELQYLLDNFHNSDYDRFEGRNLIRHIKAKKKGEHSYVSLRLSERGLQLLEDLGSAPVLEEDQKIADWLFKHYKAAGKEIGNRKKTLDHIKEFRVKSGIQKNNLIMLCVDFLKENEERSNKLQFVFYYPKTVFATRFDLEESWLYAHYLKREDYFKSVFENY